MMALGVGASGRQGVAVQDTARPRAGQGAVGELFNPDVAGRPRTPTIAGDNDAAIRAVEQKLGCTCGCTLDIFTCRTTDFTCTYSPALHREVIALASEGKTEQQIIDWCRENMAVYKVPRIVQFADALPKSGSGKVMWRLLQEAEARTA